MLEECLGRVGAPLSQLWALSVAPMAEEGRDLYLVAEKGFLTWILHSFKSFKAGFKQRVLCSPFSRRIQKLT